MPHIEAVRVRRGRGDDGPRWLVMSFCSLAKVHMTMYDVCILYIAQQQEDHNCQALVPNPLVPNPQSRGLGLTIKS